MARYYFDRYGIETACVRIGSSFPEPKDRRMLATFLSYADLHRLITACLTTPVLGYSIIFGMSNNAVTWWDNAPRQTRWLPAARQLGRVPRSGVRPHPGPRPEQPGRHLPRRRFVTMGPYEA